MVKKRVTIIFLLAITAGALYFCYLLFQPFLRPLLFGGRYRGCLLSCARSDPSASSPPEPCSAGVNNHYPSSDRRSGDAIILAIKNEVAGLYTLIDQKSTESGGLSPYLSQMLERPIQWIGRFVDLSKIDLRASVLGG